MAQVYHNAISVHLFHHGNAKRAQPAVRTSAARRVADVVVTVMAQSNVNHAAVRKMRYISDVALEGQSVFNGQGD